MTRDAVEEEPPATTPASLPPIATRSDPNHRPRSVTPTTSAQRREPIAAAAADVIARKGYAAASVREIEAAAHMQVPKLYQYVTSKEEVLELVYRWVIERLQADVEDARSIAGTSRIVNPPGSGTPVPGQ